ncbi:MAG: hypothetical protein B6I35_03710 [Anaerolineaceae bacterium 4572_32.2]|nr:MAG: hypothetical protein B6I35_03710 [Anaerolineaceae bacterium 4572_32.2]RLC80907.1 MAG: hypothetical protein DRI81_03615 [Chloroflexota bacterium]
MAQAIEIGGITRSADAGILELAKAHHVGCLKRYRNGEILYWQGDPVECLYVVKRGKIKTSVLSSAGKAHAYGVWGPGCLMGVTAYLLGKAHICMADAMENTDVWVIPLLEFERLLASDARFSLAVLKEQARTVELFVREIDSLSLMNVQQRLKHSLTRLASEYGLATDRGIKIDLDITHEEIAELTGANRSTVTAYLNDLRKQGYLWKDGRRLVIFPPQHVRILDGLKQAVVESDGHGAISWARKVVEERVGSARALDALTYGMQQVENGFARGELFAPDVIVAASAVKSALSIIEKGVRRTGRAVKPRGTVVIGTVRGDVHDLGKTMVVTLLTVGGFEVIDLGVDVSAERFLEAVRKFRPGILAMSVVMSGGAQEQLKVSTMLEQEGFRGRVKIMVGGGGITPKLAQTFGADGYEPTARGAVELARRLVEVE